MGKTFFQITSILILVSSLVGCAGIQPPGKEIIQSSKKNTDGSVEYRMKKDEFRGLSVPRNRNAIYVALDDQVQNLFQKEFKKYFKKDPPPRIETISWWVYAPLFKPLYDQVIRIPYHSFTRESLFSAIKKMETLGKPYDIFLMTHGLPNHLPTSKGMAFGFRDLKELEGKLKNLRLVYMQACFGSTLSEDWLNAGAEAVVSYPDLNRNFFYLEFLLRDLKKFPRNLERAFLETNESVLDKIAKSPKYRQLIDLMGYSLDEFYETTENPEFARR